MKRNRTLTVKLKKIQADQGKEFYNKHVRELLETRYIQLFSTSSPTRISFIARATTGPCFVFKGLLRHQMECRGRSGCAGQSGIIQMWIRDLKGGM